MTAALAAVRRRLDRSQGPFIVVLAGPNGAGKSTFHDHFLADLGLPFINADLIAREFDPENPARVAYRAARQADQVRRAMVARGESFCMETVFSDPVGDKIDFLHQAQRAGYAIFLIYIGLSDVALSIARVVQRTEVGGHDVPDAKLLERFPRTLENLRRAVPFVDVALLFDNSSASQPYRHLATFECGTCVVRAKRLPAWADVLPV